MSKEAVELATLVWVSWRNCHRLIELVSYIPAAVAEAGCQCALANQANPVAS